MNLHNISHEPQPLLDYLRSRYHMHKWKIEKGIIKFSVADDWVRMPWTDAHAYASQAEEWHKAGRKKGGLM